MNPNPFLQEALAIATSVGRSFLHILPYLALSIPLAVMLKRIGAGEKIRKSLGAKPYLAVLMATLVGALSPFCSCGVIPIITALLVSGVPLAPVMSFWLASPSMDPEIFILSVGSIGWELAVWRLAATFVMSLGGGLLILWLERKDWIGQDYLRFSALEQRADGTSGGAARGVSGPLEAIDACECGSHQEPVSGCSAKSGWQTWLRDAGGTALSLSLYMAIAFLLEALITRYVPQGLIASHLGSQSAWSIPLATLIGIPMYTTNLTSLGLVAGLLQRGMSGGAALAFLIGGAVTTLPAMSAVYGIVRWRVFALYLGISIAGSLLAGSTYQFVQTLW